MRSRVEPYTRFTNGNLLRMRSKTDIAPRVSRFDPRNPTSVISRIVATKPAPGIDRPSRPSIVLNNHQVIQSVTPIGARRISPRKK
jgi:hypothetical protein